MNSSESSTVAESFKELWSLAFPNTPPINHLLKHLIPEKWLRIHSLPESKRYAENAEEFEIILSRQNEVATDILGESANIYIVTGEFHWDNQSDNAPQYDDILKKYDLCDLDAIDLFRLDPNEYEENQTFTPAIGTVIWEPHKHDELLLEVAKDRSHAFFVSFDKQSIFAPYDGGADFIVKDEITRDYYKNKYKMYLSAREDGY
ncbi:MAG: hypothetical protein IPN71_18625 [Fibrobacteres bacterium]|nr:hypothetical protein [Fibrobacterota bacterium]